MLLSGTLLNPDLQLLGFCRSLHQKFDLSVHRRAPGPELYVEVEGGATGFDAQTFRNEIHRLHSEIDDALTNINLKACPIFLANKLVQRTHSTRTSKQIKLVYSFFFSFISSNNKAATVLIMRYSAIYIIRKSLDHCAVNAIGGDRVSS